jgi:hypothetical protein
VSIIEWIINNIIVLKDWVPLFQIISSISVVITVVYIGKTFYRTKRADEIKLTESVFKDLRTMEQEYHRPDKENFIYKNWYSRFFNTFEWFSLLVNKKEIPFNLAKEFFKEPIIKWYDDYLKEEDKQDSKKYRQLKELYRRLTDPD